MSSLKIVNYKFFIEKETHCLHMHMHIHARAAGIQYFKPAFSL